MTRAYALTDVSFAYIDEPVLRIPFLEIARGDIVGLVGANGSGKTTLLHLLAFLNTPQHGQIEFFGQTVWNSANQSIRKKVALLLQNPYLFHETVLANIMWGLRIRGFRKDQAREAAQEALEVVGLSGFEHRYAPSLSGGESQRVALARSLALKPAVLLLDEPFNHMDRESVLLTEDLVIRLSQDQRTTVVLTSHAIDKLQAMAHRVVHLWQGRLVPTGPDNLFRGSLRDNGTVFDTGRLSILLEERVPMGDFIAIDPSQITIRLGNDFPEKANTFHGRIVGLSYENGRIRVVVETGERLVAFLPYSNPVVQNLRLGLEATVVFSSRHVSIL